MNLGSKATKHPVVYLFAWWVLHGHTCSRLSTLCHSVMLLAPCREQLIIKTNVCVHSECRSHSHGGGGKSQWMRTTHELQKIHAATATGGRSAAPGRGVRPALVWEARWRLHPEDRLQYLWSVAAQPMCKDCWRTRKIHLCFLYIM